MSGPRPEPELIDPAAGDEFYVVNESGQRLDALPDPSDWFEAQHDDVKGEPPTQTVA